MRWPGFALFYVFPFATVLGMQVGGAAAWLAPALAGLVTPLLDAWLGDDVVNPSDDEAARLAAERRWRWLVWAFVPIHVGVLALGCHHATTLGSDGAAWTSLVLGVGVVCGGLAINVAHELCHRTGRLEPLLARILWVTVGYLHFHVEHRLGHHARVATPADPATARLGEGLYAFVPRSVVGGWRSAWALEAARMAALGLGMLSARNHMVWAVVAPAAIGVGLWLAWGPAAALFYVLQALAAIFTLETVNYIEHYGLERRLIAPGQYEPVGVRHSWNSSRRLTNGLLLMLQRHSDHHVNPGRRFQTLHVLAGGPELPTGYGAMVPLALVPPLWRRVMDPRARAVREVQDETGWSGSETTLVSSA